MSHRKVTNENHKKTEKQSVNRKAWKGVVKENHLTLDILNVLLGFIVIILLIVLVIKPYNMIVMSALMIVAGAMNLMNGFRQMAGRSRIRKAFYIGIGSLMFLYGLFLIKSKFLI